MRRSEEMFLGAGEVIDAPYDTLLSGIKTWKDEEGLFSRGEDRPAAVYDDGAMAWYVAGQRCRFGGMPMVVYCDGSVHRRAVSVDATWRAVSEARDESVEEVSGAEYAGVSYSVPYWLVEGYSTSREGSGV